MGDILKTVAPWLASAVMGPLGGMAVKFIADKMGVEADTAEQLSNAIQGFTPEQLAQLKLADKELEVRLTELGFKHKEELFKAEVEDRKSARGMFDRGYRLIGTISVLTILGFAGMVYLVLSGYLKGMEESELVIVGSVIGYMAAYTQQIYNYLFGSSSGSDKKTDLMNAVTKNGTTAGRTEG